MKDLHIRSQSGVVMIVCLVLLVVVTALGLASMSNSSVETKMAASFKDRAVAFEAAEEAITLAEEWVGAASFSETDFYDGCSGSQCFSDTCANGLCAFYDAGDPYATGVDRADCTSKLADPTTITPPWQWTGGTGQPNLWTSTTTSKAVQVSTTNTAAVSDARYIIEFMCYVDKTPGVSCTAGNAIACAPLFRITALAQGATPSARVMLQSKFKKVN